VGDWQRALFLHYRVPAATLQPHCAFPLDLWEGEACVSLAAFTMRRFRFARGGWLGAWLASPFREMRFLNLRTYVTVGGEPGITFLTEWLSNWFHVQLGPATYGLPYRWGRHELAHGRTDGCWHGRIRARAGAGELRYETQGMGSPIAPARAGSVDEFLLERHACFLRGRGQPRRFRIWHEPWPQAQVNARVTTDSLVANAAPWWRAAELFTAHVSPGVADVWMGRPLRLKC